MERKHNNTLVLKTGRGYKSRIKIGSIVFAISTSHADGQVSYLGHITLHKLLFLFLFVSLTQQKKKRKKNGKGLVIYGMK